MAETATGPAIPMDFYCAGGWSEDEGWIPGGTPGQARRLAANVIGCDFVEVRVTRTFLRLASDEEARERGAEQPFVLECPKDHPHAVPSWYVEAV